MYRFCVCLQSDHVICIFKSLRRTDFQRVKWKRCYIFGRNLRVQQLLLCKSCKVSAIFLKSSRSNVMTRLMSGIKFNPSLIHFKVRNENLKEMKRYPTHTLKADNVVDLRGKFERPSANAHLLTPLQTVRHSSHFQTEKKANNYLNTWTMMRKIISKLTYWSRYISLPINVVY